MLGSGLLAKLIGWWLVEKTDLKVASEFLVNTRFESELGIFQQYSEFIRLVKLSQHSDAQDEISVSCSIAIADLENAPKYVAISYACGDVHDLIPVKVDGLHTNIYRNLHAALHRISKVTDDLTTFWIDCLSIDQSNVDEKSTQVSLMSRIYRQATFVLVWLGEEDLNSTAAFRIIQGVGKIDDIYIAMQDLGATSPPLPVSKLTNLIEGLRASIYEEIELPNEAVLPNWDESATREWQGGMAQIIGTWAMRAVKDLLLRPWWHRLWIRQELLLAQSTLFMCGSDVCQGWHMINGLTNLLGGETIRYLETECGLPASMSYKFHSARMLIARSFTSILHGNDQGPWSLLDLLEDNHDSECYLGQDKIFALQGIAVGELVKLNYPDYSMSTEQVYERFVRTSIEVSHSIDVLRYSSSSKIGSWIPDWRQRVPLPNIAPLDFRQTHKKIYSASLDKSPLCEFPPAKENTFPRILKVFGLEVDQTYRVGMYATAGFTASPVTPVLQQWRTLALEEAILEEDFWLTLTLDRSNDFERLTSTENADFVSTTRSWLQSESRTAWPNEDFRQMVSKPERCELFVTKHNRWLGVAETHGCLKSGDLICVLFGAQTPFILRPQGQHHILLGGCYVKGIMDGEALEMDQAASMKAGYYSLG